MLTALLYFTLDIEKVNNLLEGEPIDASILNTVSQPLYGKLCQTVSKVPQCDMLLTMGDMNAKVGADGCRVMNDIGEHLADFCLDSNCDWGYHLSTQRHLADMEVT